ncbi:MAG: hypothetical protein WD939_04955 [Dehalococcoidia bacterium]
MPQPPWQTAFDRLGLVAYFTIVTGQLPDSSLLSYATREVEEQEPDPPAVEEVQQTEREPLATAA